MSGTEITREWEYARYTVRPSLLGTFMYQADILYSDTVIFIVGSHVVFPFNS